MASAPPIIADAPKVVWAIDFQFDSTIDEHTRESLLDMTERSITAQALVDELERVFTTAGGPPKVLRMDNGPELISQALQKFCHGKVDLYFIPPGQPWRNGYVWVLYLDCRLGRCFPGGCSKLPALTLDMCDVARTVLDSKCRAGRRGAGLGCWLKESMFDSTQICRRRTLRFLTVEAAQTGDEGWSNNTASAVLTPTSTQ